MITLRPYQEAALGELRARAAEGLSRLLFVAPTGAGKTVLASALIAGARACGSRVLFIAHRYELIEQAVRQIATGGTTHIGVIRADDERTDPTAPVQVATIQSLSRRKLPSADVVIVDEAHRVMGASYQRAVAAYPDATIIGLTATPCRLDGKPLGDIFQKIVMVASYSQLIELGNIVKPKCFTSPIDMSLEDVKTRAGDYDLEALEIAMTEPKILGSVAEEWQRLSGGRRSVVFACTIAHSKAIQRTFSARGISCEHLDGNTPLAQRIAILARLDTGETKVVSNVGVLCEGWDQPSVKYIAIVRPTKSLALYMQMAGRALRPWNGVTPIICDHGGNLDRHGMPYEDREWSLDAPVKSKGKGKGYRTCPACYAMVESNPCPECGHDAEAKARKIREDAEIRLQEREFSLATERAKRAAEEAIAAKARAELRAAREQEAAKAAGKVATFTAAGLKMMANDPRKLFFDSQVEYARSRGFKPGYAGAKFKEKFESWPPWAWSKSAKTGFDCDHAWQARHSQREQTRAFWQQVKAHSDSETVEIPDDEIPF